MSIRMAFLSLLTAASLALAGQDRYWQLGSGTYGGALRETESIHDLAQYDWVYLCFGNVPAKQETVDTLNAALAINPKLKIVIRVWPIMGLGDCPQNRQQATFLHFLYLPEVHQKVLQNVRDQIRLVLDNLSRPENVIGSTFLEELPGHFTGAPFGRNDAVTWDLERFRKEIEAERGVPLVWDDATRKWWAAKYVQALGDIHKTMKEASDGRLVFYYQQTNHVSLDMVPADTPLSKRMLIPLHWSEIIKPGLCDGFFAYPNGQAVWERYLGLAREHDWYFFAQLPHPGNMRLASWPDAIELVKTKDPHNLGYFFYCEGDCQAGRWNDDPDLPAGAEWHSRPWSIPLHCRRFLAGQKVGLDVRAKRPALKLSVDAPLNEVKPGGYLHLTAVIEHVMPPSCFLDPAEAVAKNVTARVQLPAGLTLDPRVSVPASVRLDDLPVGGRAVVDWWVTVADDWKPGGAVTLTAGSANLAGDKTTLDRDTALDSLAPRTVKTPGATWIEPGYRLADDLVPDLTLQAVRGEVRNPSLSCGADRLTWRGKLVPGTRLSITATPTLKATLHSLPLVDATRERGREEPFSDGYLVDRYTSRAPVTPGEKLHATISGRADEGGNSLILLRFQAADGKYLDSSILANRFKADWQDAVTQEVEVPAGARSLYQVLLYRFKQTGRVWYGTVKVERAAAADTDVTDRLSGAPPMIPQGRYAVLTYTDDTPSYESREVELRLAKPAE